MTPDHILKLLEQARAEGWTDGYIAGLAYAQQMIAARIPVEIEPLPRGVTQ